jgi:hypothetical protein
MNPQALDGPLLSTGVHEFKGLFTGTLKTVWNGGTFS